MTNLGGIYRARRTPLHLVPAWAKALAVAIGSFLITGIHDWRVSAVVAAASALVLASALPPWAPTARTLGTFAVFAGIGLAFHAWRGDPATGAAVGLNVFAVVGLSLALVASTASSDLLSLFAGLARPVRRWVPPETLGLAASLMVRSLPEAARIVAESRDAARARGLARSPHATLVPAGVRVVAYALAVGEAVTARGLADGPPAT